MKPCSTTVVLVLLQIGACLIAGVSGNDDLAFSPPVSLNPFSRTSASASKRPSTSYLGPPFQSLRGKSDAGLARLQMQGKNEQESDVERQRLAALFDQLLKNAKSDPKYAGKDEKTKEEEIYKFIDSHANIALSSDGAVVDRKELGPSKSLWDGLDELFNTKVKRVYVKSGCPESMRLVLFLAETGKLKDIDLVYDSEVVCERMMLLTGGSTCPEFPLAELDPAYDDDPYLVGTDLIIDLFTMVDNIDETTLPVYTFFMNGVYPMWHAMTDRLDKEAKVQKCETSETIVRSAITSRAQVVPVETQAPASSDVDTQEGYKIKAFVKKDCPFSTKFLVFMAEAGLMEKIQVVYDLPGPRAYLQKTGGKQSFPAIEVFPGVIVYESDDIISYFASKYNVDKSSMKALKLYSSGIGVGYVAMVNKLKQLNIDPSSLLKKSFDVLLTQVIGALVKRILPF